MKRVAGTRGDEIRRADKQACLNRADPGAAAIRDNIFLSDSDGDDSFGRKIDFNPAGVQAPGKPVEVKKGAAKVEDESRSSDDAPSTGVASPKEANHAATTTTSQDAADKGAATGTEENAAKGDDSSDDLHFSSDTDDNEKPKPWKVEPKSEKSNDADDDDDVVYSTSDEADGTDKSAKTGLDALSDDEGAKVEVGKLIAHR